MKKIIFILVIISASVGFTGCTTKNNDTNNQQPSITQNKIDELPTRPAEINGTVRSIEGNEIVIANEIKNQILTEEEKEAQKIERQKLSQEERQALRQEAAAAAEIETVTLTIPVGVPIVKASGTGDGSVINAQLDEIKSGSYISIWVNDGEAEAVKLKGVN